LKDLKILSLDLEMSYALGFFFPSKKPQYIPARNITHHQYCICASWSWDHEVSVYNERCKKPWSDKNIAIKLSKLINEADIVTAHNGDNFDMKHINTLLIKHGLAPIPPKKTLDTLKIARKYFAFAGNGLSDLLRFFNIGDKEEKPDWYEATMGDKEAMEQVVKYCNVDVIQQKKILAKFKPFINNYPTLRSSSERPKVCDACGSNHINVKDKCAWRSGNRFVTVYECMTCRKCHTVPLRGIKLAND
jgi:DNA polymerase elongation subunit (family B)